jgi:hypothetical protein
VSINWLLVISYWLLVISYWLLVISYWLLVIGYHQREIIIYILKMVNALLKEFKRKGRKVGAKCAKNKLIIIS